jgi:CheY-like chemotaxis protein
VHTAYGPREAIEMFREVQPSVVFMDISMPELSGLEAAARIRSLPEGTSTTIIALTGLGHEQDRRRSREASIDHHLVKPASPAALHRLLSGIQPITPAA